MTTQARNDSMDLPRLLIVDDEPRIREFFVRMFSSDGWVVGEAEDGPSAQKMMNDNPFDVVVTDLKMPGMDGIELMRWLNANHPETQKILLTAYGSVNAAISAVREGAYDFISKPIQNFDRLKITIQRAYEAKRLSQQNRHLLDQLTEKNKLLSERLSELQVAYDLLKEQSRALKEDLLTAQRIQLHLLPGSFPNSDTITFSSFYHPSSNVGGDIFDVVEIDKDNIVAYIADASGHGVSSAMMAVFLKQLIKPVKYEESKKLILSPADVLAHLNEMIFLEGVQDTVFVTMLYTHINLSDMVVKIATAGHPSLIVRRQNGEIDTIGCHCPALGIRRESRFCQESTNVGERDIMLMYTDGITNCEDEKGNRLGKNGLFEEVRSSKDSISELHKRIIDKLRKYSGGVAQEDDMSMLLAGFMKEEVPPAPPLLFVSPVHKTERATVSDTNILFKQEAETLYYVIQGKGTWKESRPFMISLKEGIGKSLKHVVVDFGLCDYLDSTFLGTLQQITEMAGSEDGFEFTIQNVPVKVLDDLKELCMEDVIVRIIQEPVRIPDEMIKMDIGITNRSEYAKHIFTAHNILSRLSESNREKFRVLLETLRKQTNNE